MVYDVPIFILIEKLQKLQLLADDRFLLAPLRNKMNKIVNELQRILTFLEQDNANTKTLMDQLLPILNSAEYFIESFLLKTTRRRHTKMPLLVYAPWSQVQLSCKLKEIEKKIRAVSTEFRKVDTTSNPIPQALGLDERHSDFVQHHYDETLDLIVGRGDTEKELVGRLIDNEEQNLRVLSLVSEESLGKTALAKKVYNRLDVRQHFPCRVWVHDPEDFTYTDLLLIIIAQLPIGVVKDVELMKEDQLSDMLFQYFMEVKFLMVLDNVPGVDLWHKLVRPFADSANGSRVMITTRKTDVASQADPWSRPVRLESLNEEDSWVLFRNKVKAGTPKENDPEKGPQDDLSDHNLKEKIFRICRGLPPAIVLLGGVLSTMGVSRWSSVIDHFPHLRGEDDHPVPLSSILSLSYRKLPFVLRPCFLYLALFPKMYEIPIRRLLHLWLAEGFVQTSTKATTSVIPEDIAQGYLEDLVHRNMIEIATRKLDGSPNTCRLPCFLHDVFLSKAEDIGFLHVHHCKTDCTYPDSPNNNFFIHRLADQCYGGFKSTSESHTHNLCSYLMFEIQKRNTSNKEVEALLKRIMHGRNVALLKVIDLESIYRPVLPDKLGELQNLTYIGLRWTCLYSCPASIGDLPCLETLDLKYTNITTLPSSIWKAKKLRHLYMNEVPIEKPSKEPSAHLQTLVGLQVGSNDPNQYGLTRLTSLRKLRLTCHSRSVNETVKCISRFRNLQTLKLSSRDSFGQALEIVLGDEFKVHPSLLSLSLFGVTKDGIANLPQNLKTLALSMSQLKEADMQQLGQLPQLNILSLLARSYSGKKMEYCKGTFPELRVLKLWKLENLEEWGVEEGGLPKLEEMEIRGCDKLKKFEGSEHLHALKELVLTNMPKDFAEAVGKNSIKEKLVTNEWRVDEKVNELSASSSMRS